MLGARGHGVEATERRRVERLRAQVRDPCVCVLRLDQPRRCLVGLSRGGQRPCCELGGLVGKRAAAALELEQHCLAGLAREPHIAAVGVVADAFRGDRDARLELVELRALDEPDSVEQADGVLGTGDERGERAGADDGRGDVLRARRRDDDGEVAETARPRSVDQVEGVALVAREQRRRAPRERGGDGRLVPGLHLEGRERESLAFLRERARRGGDALTLGQRALERREPLAGSSCPLGDVVALARCSSCLEPSGVGTSFELGRIRSAAPRVGACGLVALGQLACELGRDLTSSAQPLACGSE